MTQLAHITGASRGLGFALAEALAPTHHIIAVARTSGALEDLDDRIQAKGGSATLAPMDITDAAAMATLCRGIHDRWGQVALWAHTGADVSCNATQAKATRTSVLTPIRSSRVAWRRCHTQRD